MPFAVVGSNQRVCVSASLLAVAFLPFFFGRVATERVADVLTRLVILVSGRRKSQSRVLPSAPKLAK